MFRSTDEGGEDAFGYVGAGEACADGAGAVVENYGGGEEGVGGHYLKCARLWERVQIASEYVTLLEHRRATLVIHDLSESVARARMAEMTSSE